MGALGAAALARLRQTALVLLLGACSAALAGDWATLSPAQQRALAPLQPLWAQIEGSEQTMWLELADRDSGLSPTARQRLQQRMIEWSRLSPVQRGQARLQFQEAARWPAAERNERWQAYQSLDPQARRVLAERWKLEAAARAQEQRELPAPGSDKRNVFERPPASPRPARAATPTAAAARAGATTRPLLAPRDEALAQPQHGMPKIAATPSFVDPATLLPRRGPQAAAAVQARPASAPRAAR